MEAVFSIILFILTSLLAIAGLIAGLLFLYGALSVILYPLYLIYKFFKRLF